MQLAELQEAVRAILQDPTPQASKALGRIENLFMKLEGHLALTPGDVITLAEAMGPMPLGTFLLAYGLDEVPITITMQDYADLLACYYHKDKMLPVIQRIEARNNM